MASVTLKICDVMQARGQQVPADRTVTLRIPAAASPTGKAYSRTLDVCHQGETALGKMRRDAEAATTKAWEPLMALNPPKTRDASGTEDESGALPPSSDTPVSAENETVAPAHDGVLSEQDGGFPERSSDFSEA